MNPFLEWKQAESETNCLPWKKQKSMVVYQYTLTLLHSEKPKLHAILVFLDAVGLNTFIAKWQIIL